MATSSTTGTAANAAVDLASLEIDAKSKARVQVANLLQRPDQLDKVEQIRKRNSRKRASVEAQLKTAVQSQLDGVRTGLNQLHNALKDIRDIKSSLADVNTTYTSISTLGEKLRPVREENSRHSQLAAAVENLKHIFTVPETVKKCEDFILDGKLLHAHKCLCDLEGSRDDLLFELHKQASPSPTDKNTVNQYFANVARLSEELGKQLWLILQRTIMTVRREPTIIVTVLRIIEREERTDGLMLKRYDQTNFLPPGRPKRWRQKAFQVLEDAVLARIEGNQMEDRTMNKMWLVRHLEVTRQLVLEDLRVARTLCESCFPPHYDIANKYVEMYHNSITQHLNDVVQQGLEGNEIISLLTWIHEYSSKEMMGHPDLKLKVAEFTPLLEPTVISELQNQYLQTLRSNLQEWMSNSLKSDVKDWWREIAPESDDKGYYLTSLPVIMLQMIEQNLAVASTISEDLVRSALSVVVDELDFFVKTYKGELVNYKEKHFQDRSQPQFFLHYMIANINNCQTFSTLVGQIRDQYIGEEKGTDANHFRTLSDSFNNLAFDLCDYLIEEVMTDLDQHVQDLMTRKWLQSTTCVDTICITIEDYCQDFVHLRDRFYEMLLKKTQIRVAKEYYKALFSRKISFKSYEERGPAADKMCQEGDQLKQLFSKLIPTSQEDSPFLAIPGLSEVIRLKDTSMMSLEISGFVNNYPDVRMEQLVNLLMMRGDVNRSESKQMVEDCLGQDHDLKPKGKKTIFSRLGH